MAFLLQTDRVNHRVASLADSVAGAVLAVDDLLARFEGDGLLHQRVFKSEKKVKNIEMGLLLLVYKFRRNGLGF